MKKIIALILALAAVLSLFSCGEKKYAPIESTEEEKTVIATVTYGGENYEIKYELYRALFLNFSEEFDGGDKTFWDKPESADAKAKINEKILSYAKDLFATIALAKTIGFDAYSKDADDLVYDLIKASVEGGGNALGYGGDYDAYLASLKDMNLNYSVQTLLYRYSLAYSEILTYYAGDLDPENPLPGASAGSLKYTKEDVEEFYYGEDSVRVSVIEMNAEYIPIERIQQIRDEIAKFSNTTGALNYAIGHTSGNPDDILNGVVIGTLSLDSAYYADVTAAAMALSVGETSQPINVVAENENKYWILYAQSKDAEYLNEFYEEVESVYKSQKIGEMLYGVKNGFSEPIYTDAFESLVYSEISMK
jgi:hypothetical protein